MSVADCKRRAINLIGTLTPFRTSLVCFQPCIAENELNGVCNKKIYSRQLCNMLCQTRIPDNHLQNRQQLRHIRHLHRNRRANSLLNISRHGQGKPDLGFEHIQMRVPWYERALDFHLQRPYNKRRTCGASNGNSPDDCMFWLLETGNIRDHESIWFVLKKKTGHTEARAAEQEEMPKRNLQGASDETQEGPPEKKLAQTPKELYDELNVRILNEQDAARKADYRLQKAEAFCRMKEVEVNAADLEGDPFKRREAHLALFEAKELEKKKAEWELKKAEAELKATSATTVMKPVWEDQLLEAVSEMKRLGREWPTRYEQRKQELEQQIPSLPPPSSSQTSGRVLPPLPTDGSFVLPVYKQEFLSFVDDGDRVQRIVRSMNISLSRCGGKRTGDISAEIITGHPGIGKTRLAFEVAKAFVNERPLERCMFDIALREEEVPSMLRPFMDGASTELLGAIFAMKLIAINPAQFSLRWNDISKQFIGSFPNIRTIALVVDEFNSALDVSERIISACGAWNSDERPFYVLPIFAGVHRARVSSDLYGMSARLSGKMSTNVTLVSSLSEAARLELVKSLASSVNVPTELLQKCLGPLLEDCGGWPSFVSLLQSVLTVPDFQASLEQIRTRGELGTDTGKLLWNELVQQFSRQINIRRFAELVSTAKTRLATIDPPAYVTDAKQRTRSTILAKLVLERLLLLGMTSKAVTLNDCILREEDLPAAITDENVKDITYQLAGGMVEVRALPRQADEEERGMIIMPVIAIAALNESIGMKSNQRVLLNPFENTPTVLETLAIESVANILKVNRNLHETRIQLDDLRPGTRRWGRHLWIHVPDRSKVVQLADHLELSDDVIVSTEPNGRGIPITLEEGVCFTAAVNQKALDGGAILKMS